MHLSPLRTPAPTLPPPEVAAKRARWPLAIARDPDATLEAPPPAISTLKPSSEEIDLVFDDDLDAPRLRTNSASSVTPAYFVELFTRRRSPRLLAVRATLDEARDIADAVPAAENDVVIRELMLPWDPTTSEHQLESMRTWRRDRDGCWCLRSPASKRSARVADQ